MRGKVRLGLVGVVYSTLPVVERELVGAAGSRRSPKRERAERGPSTSFHSVNRPKWFGRDGLVRAARMNRRTRSGRSELESVEETDRSIFRCVGISELRRDDSVAPESHDELVPLDLPKDPILEPTATEAFEGDVIPPF